MNYLENPTRTRRCLLLIISVSLLLHILCMAQTDLLAEEAYYWNYAQHLDFSYLDHPPMVALLIKLSTSMFGTHELSLRVAAVLCWVFTVFFSLRWTYLINPRASLHALMFLAVLPFFFVQSLVITPDLPLMACWSGTLYSLYRALILKEAPYWYCAGFWFGLGMLSKYTISLLSLATVLYLVLVPEARIWWKRKEPYLCAALAVLLFTPVLYWNAVHQWASFLFQSKRRFDTTTAIDLPYLLGLVFVFITPLGVYSLVELFKKHSLLQNNEKHFIQIFTLVPLGFFALYSLNHEINLNWIGPLFLALIPWLATQTAKRPKRNTFWLMSAFLLLMTYGSILLFALLNTSPLAQEKFFNKLIAWEPLIKEFHSVAQNLEVKTATAPVFVPLDNFPIGSELAFYQAKFLKQNRIHKSYPIVGSHIFGGESLMYRYWSKEVELKDKLLILISREIWPFELDALKNQVKPESELKTLYSRGQGKGVQSAAFYYQIVRLKAEGKLGSVDISTAAYVPRLVRRCCRDEELR